MSSNNSRCPDFTIAAERKDEEAPKWPIEDGKLFNDIRSWTCDDGLLGYNELFDFMNYIDKFASRIVGQQLFNRYVPHAIDSNAAPPAPRMSYEDFYKQSQE